MLLQIWTLYLDSLVTNPLLTKCITSAVGFIVGDSLAQLITAQPYSSLRTLRFAVIGFTLHAPVADTWFRFLEKAVYPEASASMKAVLVKMALDQLLMAPAFLVVFFLVTKTLEGHPEKLLEVLREKYLKTVLVGYILWPLAHIINFRFVPNDLRILYVNVVQIGWNVVLCRMTSASATRPGKQKHYIEKKLSPKEQSMVSVRSQELSRRQMSPADLP